MIELDEHEGSYLAICKHYRAVYETGEIKESPEKAKEVYKYLPVTKISCQSKQEAFANHVLHVA